MKENYYTSIKEKILRSELYDRVRDYEKDKNKVTIYFEIGELLHKAGKEYGKNIIKSFSKRLLVEVGKKYNERNLRYMRKFYEIMKKIKWNAACSNLSWSHYREILSINNTKEIIFYLKQCEINNLSTRQLHEKIKTKEYDRLPETTKNKLIKNYNTQIFDMIPNPIIIKATTEIEKLSEYTLKELILSQLDTFLFQLGQGFTYIGNEYKIKIGDRYNYIDLFLYNIKYKCYVVVELKVKELNSMHTGQIQNYMNYVDKNIKTSEENATVGIIICRKNNEYVIEYCTNKKILSRKYQIV